MTDKTDLAYRAASAAAQAILESVVESVKDAIKDSDVTADDLQDRINEEVDNALIYTADQYSVVWGLPDPDEDAISDSGAEDWSEALSKHAFQCLRTAVDGAEDWSQLCEAAAEEDEEENSDEEE